MDIITILFVAIGLSMDSFAVSVVNGFSIKELNPKNILLIATSFAIFQTAMPVIGWFAGTTVESYIKNFDHWIAFILLLYLGSGMLYRSGEEKQLSGGNVIKLSTVITQSFATSVDALAVGLSFAVLEMGILYPVLIIGVTTFLFSVFGLLIGKLSGKKLQRSSEIIGGIILILIGLRILVEHLFIRH